MSNEEDIIPAYLDEKQSQHAADMRVLIDHIGEQRLQLAVLKLTYYLLKAGTPVQTNYTGNPVGRLAACQRDIEQKRAEIETLQVILQDIHDGGVIPEPSPLTLASALPNGSRR